MANEIFTVLISFHVFSRMEARNLPRVGRQTYIPDKRKEIVLQCALSGHLSPLRFGPLKWKSHPQLIHWPIISRRILMSVETPTRKERWRTKHRELPSKGKGRPATATFSSRENSSNGGKPVKTFLAKSYEPQKQGVKKFFDNKYICFQLVRKMINNQSKCLSLRQKVVGA